MKMIGHQTPSEDRLPVEIASASHGVNPSSSSFSGLKDEVSSGDPAIHMENRAGREESHFSRHVSLLHGVDGHEVYTTNPQPDNRLSTMADNIVRFVMIVERGTRRFRRGRA
jgi:hypothetical protein